MDRGSQRSKYKWIMVGLAIVLVTSAVLYFVVTSLPVELGQTVENTQPPPGLPREWSQDQPTESTAAPPAQILEVLQKTPGETCIRGRLFGNEGVEGPAQITVTTLIEAPSCGEILDVLEVAKGQSGSEGEFVITGLPFGAYAVMIALTNGWGARAEVNLTEAQPCAELSLVAAPLFALEGVVVDEADAAVPGATVTVVGRDGLPVRQKMNLASRTGNLGEFIIYPLPPGEWKLQACAPGYASTSTRWYASAEADLRIVLSVARALEGAIYSAETDAPLPGLLVEARSAINDRKEGQALSDGQGKFIIDSIGEGSLYLSLNDPNFSLVDPAGRVKVRPDSIPAILYASEGATVRGTVYNGSGEGMEGFTIILYRSGIRRESKPTGVDGRYSIAGIPPGRASFYPRFGGQDLLGAVSKYMELAPGADVEQVDFTIEGASLRGKVLLADGSGVAGAAVRAQSESDELLSSVFYHCVTDASGVYQLFNMNQSLSFNLSASTIFSSSEPVGPISFEQSLEREQDLVLTLDRSAVLSGKVVDERGKAVVGTVHFTVARGGNALPVEFVDTGLDGEFTLGVPDKCRVDFLVGVKIRTWQPMTSPVPPTPPFIDFEAASFRAPLILKVKTALGEGTISGRVIDTWGDPVYSASVTPVKADGAYVPGLYMTDMDGRFILKGLSDGKYTVRANHSSYARTELENVPTGAAEIEIELHPRPLLAGKVVDVETQEPLHAFELQLLFPFSSPVPEGAIRIPNEGRWTPFASRDGSFSMEYTENGEVSLLCRAEGYEIADMPLNLDDGEFLDGIVLELRRSVE